MKPKRRRADKNVLPWGVKMSKYGNLEE